MAFNASVEEEWESAASYLLNSKFGLPEDAQTPGEKKRVAISSATFQPTLKLLPNDFPYNFEGGIRHYCLWKVFAPDTQERGLTAHEIRRGVEELCEIVRVEKGGDENLQIDTCFFVNPVVLKSVLEIEHAHILARVTRK